MLPPFSPARPCYRWWRLSRALIGGLLLLSSDLQGAADVPELVHYQGFIRSDGQAANGSFQLKFTIYDAATEGTALWTETQTVQVADGMFSLMLGGVNPLGAMVFDGAERWLGIGVGTEPELTPRQRFGATPYALRASQVQRIGAGTVIAGNTSNGILVALFGDGPVEGPREKVAPGAALVGKTRSVAEGAAAIHGIASATTGETAGLRGESWSSRGVGVYGRAQDAAQASTAVGVRGESSGGGGRGVEGWATGSEGAGGVFMSHGENGVGVRAWTLSVNGTARGGEFFSESTDGVGVRGYGFGLGRAYGGWFTTDGRQGVGVMGEASDTDGENYGGKFSTASTKGVGVLGEATSLTGASYAGRFTSASSEGIAVFGKASALVGTNYGGNFTSAGLQGVGVQGTATAGIGDAWGGRFVNHSTVGGGVSGLAKSELGEPIGVYGESDSEAGTGVFGWTPALDGITYAVHGKNDSTNDFANAAAAVYGEATRAAIGGRFDSASGIGIRIKSRSGNIIEGHNASQLAFKVDNKGNVFADGTYQSPAADFAEMLPGATDLEPGDVLAVGLDGRVTKAGGEKAHAVIGVYSTQPAFLGGARPSSAGAGLRVPVAILGVVPVKASAENGSIRPNDSLSVSKMKAGRAAKAVPLFVLGNGEAVYAGGTLVGRALEPLEEGDGMIQVLVQLR